MQNVKTRPGNNELRRGSTKLRTQGTDRRLTGKVRFYRGARIEQRLEGRVSATTEELFAVVSAHAPIWLEETRYNRIADALRAGGGKLLRAFFELFDLLEQYAPRWYKKNLHDKAELLFRDLNATEKSTQESGINRPSQPPNL